MVDGTDRLLLPGLHNAHTHSFTFLAKGAYAPQPLEMMVLSRSVQPPDHPIAPPPESNKELTLRRYRAGAMATGLHTLLSGGTSLIDMTSVPEDP